jgi:hypothetical protein
MYSVSSTPFTCTSNNPWPSSVFTLLVALGIIIIIIDVLLSLATTQHVTFTTTAKLRPKIHIIATTIAESTESATAFNGSNGKGTN